ncbi:hypothetical protein [Streptomyces sp. NPDC057910]|uniref:hypothetical protein n=1 Tax=Streptomyces sp. NPDC057910 TaxID=3346278 RepID=UPI0036ED2954
MVRRQRHVRGHHPNATLTGSDPNLAELQQAGLTTGVTRTGEAEGSGALSRRLGCGPAGVERMPTGRP